MAQHHFCPPYARETLSAESIPLLKDWSPAPTLQHNIFVIMHMVSDITQEFSKNIIHITGIDPNCWIHS
ncbi:conserved hypothetical protein [Ricinus communis]|uniref:Uncharacterized protein n=1 Tax=Ricinus communis TaxID=3988 RepID=B9T0R0_RICCO|nr:conserved hypothetical protein [Ricinus communis]